MLSIGVAKFSTGPSPPSEQPMPYPAYLLLFVFSAGALGAVLGRAFKLGRQSVYVGTASRDVRLGFAHTLREDKAYGRKSC
jgi:hypothetical protein